MAQDAYQGGMLPFQADDESDEGTALLGRARVGGAALVVVATDVADAHGAMVPPEGMCTVAVVGAALLDGAVQADDVVVADAVEAAFAVPAVDVGHAHVLPGIGRRAVDDDGVLRVILGRRDFDRFRGMGLFEYHTVGPQGDPAVAVHVEQGQEGLARHIAEAAAEGIPVAHEGTAYLFDLSGDFAEVAHCDHITFQLVDQCLQQVVHGEERRLFPMG